GPPAKAVPSAGRRPVERPRHRHRVAAVAAGRGAVVDHRCDVSGGFAPPPRDRARRRCDLARPGKKGGVIGGGRALLVVAILVAVAGCTPTARTAGPYAAKATKTADAVHSAVGSDLLLLQSVEKGHTIAPYVSASTSRAEDAAASAASTFLSIQPPDDKSDQLRDEL